ncbi:expressed unknown protein [Seminavis robusta]|uniref:Uncharacterized protein n=1 Tax=Seminavis robusta TaxID=568900 RepID=A0A9N8H2K1_9STRA|nr:expressed unknown protein [Seminavis robusta]|eukprot:Sro67_g037500.1 n/a (164) ;mRNA; f:40608-41099
MTRKPGHNKINAGIDVAAVLSGVFYGTSMFAVGFPMGAIRTLAIEPLLGDELEAVLLEIPIMLLFCWQLSKQALMIWHILNACAGLFWDSYHTHTTTIFTISFGTLLLWEMVLSVVIFHKSLDETRHDLGTAKGAFGLAAQLLACSFPMIQEVALERHMLKDT